MSSYALCSRVVAVATASAISRNCSSNLLFFNQTSRFATGLVGGSNFRRQCFSSKIEAMEQLVAANRRVLSIQSHVVHGYVGNKSATFPLQVSF